MSEQRERTPAEIVRGLARTAEKIGAIENAEALLAAADALGREQARAQQTCGTCDEWQAEALTANSPRPLGVCYSGAYGHDEPYTSASHSCAAYTPKEADRG